MTILISIQRASKLTFEITDISDRTVKVKLLLFIYKPTSSAFERLGCEIKS